MPVKKNTPPRLPRRFLRWYCRAELLDEVEGDLAELFERRVEEEGLWKARLLYCLNVLMFLHPDYIRKRKNTYSNNTAMFKNYLTIGWRNLNRHKGYSLINIGGLAIGMAVALVIGLWLHDELTFNQYHRNYERLAWVMQNQTFEGEIQTWESQARELAPVLRDEYGTYFEEVITASFIYQPVIKIDDKAITKAGYFMEPEAPEMFSLKMLSGTRDGLTETNSVLLSESTARALFGEQDPMNQMIEVGEGMNVQVTGVYEDLPENSTLAFMEFLLPWQLQEQNLPGWIGWGNSWFQTIVLLREEASMAQVSSLIRDAKLRHVDENEARFKPELFLQPMSRMHLYSEFKNGQNVGGRIRYVWMFGIIAAFVLALACINFMNLSTARSEKRAKEIGIRKAIGSLRQQLLQQFYTEALLIAVLSFLVSIGLVQLSLPFFNDIAQKELYLLWSSPVFWLICGGFVLVTGLLAGSYPALFLSSIQTVKVIKGTYKTGRKAALPRKALVVVQFAVSLSLIIGTIIVFQQIQHVKDRPIGYQPDRLLIMPIQSEQLNRSFETVRQELLQTEAVAAVAKSEENITRASITNSGLSWRGKTPGMQDEFTTMRVTHDFGETIGWNIVEGRDFSQEFSSDSMSFVINEAAAEYMGLEDPVGEQIRWGDNGTYTVIGVVEDMITESPYSPVRQMFFFIDYGRTNYLNVRLNPEVGMQEALARIESVIKKHDPVSPFTYSFADEQYARKFGNEMRIGKLAGIFAALAIFISCMGLLGMASYMAEQRTKEIGIRKVLGASVSQLWQLMTRDFVLLVSVAVVVAVPLAYYLMKEWLQNYHYRIDISWLVFAIAALGAVMVTIVTVSFQTIKSAVANPVDSLRSE